MNDGAWWLMYDRYNVRPTYVRGGMSHEDGAYRTPVVWSKITDRGSQDVKQRSRRYRKRTQTIWLHRLEHGMSSFSGMLNDVIRDVFQ